MSRAREGFNTKFNTGMKKALRSKAFLVERRGFEPLTPTLPVLCATNCANAPGAGKPAGGDSGARTYDLTDVNRAL